MLIWVGENSQHTGEFNSGATWLITQLLDNIATGDYATSDRARNYTQGLPTSPASSRRSTDTP